ncbi:Hypothetical predicted protein, partial [Paramuricea clavata]
MAISNQAIRQGARYFGAVYGELSKGQGLQRLILKKSSILPIKLKKSCLSTE